jgi:ubiquinone/menaquinone biosynthesis C-methylase UbiE
MKDNFSTGSDQYAQYRPTYPLSFFEYLNTIVPNKHSAWDCATGNGQIAHQLTHYFDTVCATDISTPQLANAIQNEKISYSLQAAEHTNFPDNYFDLVIIGQAIHWFDFDQFYKEVRRTVKKQGIIIVIGYGKLEITPELDELIENFYTNILGPYWDKERKYIDDHYQTIPFPFEIKQTPDFEHNVQWTFEHLIGYLGTWSAVKHYMEQKVHNPIDLVYNTLKAAWGKTNVRTIIFPLLLKVGKI